jgi:hypothetical protein
MEAALNGPSGRTILGPADVTLGRLSSNQVMVNDPKASSRHATLRPEGQSYSITDLGSTNGTFVNEQMLSPNAPYTLNPGDRIRIGDATFTYEVTGAPSIAPTAYGNPGQGYDPTVAAASPYANNPGYLPTEAASPYSQYAASPPPAYQPPPPDYQVPPAQPSYQAPPAPYSPYGAPPQPAYGAPPPGIGTPGAPSGKRNNRTLWIILGIVGVVVVLGIIASVVVFAVVANSSTPTRTLQAYCDAIKSRDYQTAYSQLSSNVQNQVTEAQFASVEDGGIKTLKGVNRCSVSNVSQSDTTATGTITYTFGNGTSGPLPYALVKESNTWKISREGNGG